MSKDVYRRMYVLSGTEVVEYFFMFNTTSHQRRCNIMTLAISWPIPNKKTSLYLCFCYAFFFYLLKYLLSSKDHDQTAYLYIAWICMVNEGLCRLPYITNVHNNIIFSVLEGAMKIIRQSLKRGKNNHYSFYSY